MGGSTAKSQKTVAWGGATQTASGEKKAAAKMNGGNWLIKANEGKRKGGSEIGQDSTKRIFETGAFHEGAHEVTKRSSEMGRLGPLSQ